MKKILQIVSCMELGGTEAFIMNNYRELDRTKYQFDFLIFHEKNYPYLQEIKSLGGKVFFSGAPSLGNVNQFSKEFKKIIVENGPYAAVHSHVNIDNGIPLREAYRCGIPIRISHSHDTSGKDVNWIRKPWYSYKAYLIRKYATHLLACSKSAGAYLYGKEQFTRRGRFIPNGIDIRRFLEDDAPKTKALQEALQIDPKCPLVVGNISRFEQKKNSLFTIKVFDSILKLVPDAVLIMGGPDGGQLDACKTLVRELKIQENVRFIGERKDVPLCLKLMDIYLFPSLYEGLGIAFLEAQASGCFCVASDGVSSEADVGLGSAIFVELTKDATQWAKEILNRYASWIKPEKEVIMAKFLMSGFEITEAHKRLIEVYDEQ